MKTRFKILIIDDAFFIRNLIKKSIINKPEKTTVDGQTLNFEIVGEACDGKEALDLCAELNPDIITLDLNMPKLNGMDVIKTLQKTQPNIKIIVVTSNKSKEIAEKIIGLNCRFIQKPFQDHLLYKDLDEMAQLINGVRDTSSEIVKPAYTQKSEKEIKNKKNEKINTKKNEQAKIDKNSILTKMQNSFTSINDDFSYFEESDTKASNKKGDKIIDDLDIENNDTTKEILNIEEIMIEEPEIETIELDLNKENEEFLNIEETHEEIESRQQETKPLELSLTKEEMFDDLDEFDDMDELIFTVEEEHVEDTISEDMKKKLEEGAEGIDFQDMDEKENEYIRFSKNDIGENNEYLELLMSMTYSYNMEIGYKLEQLATKKIIENNRQKMLDSKLEELKDPNLHSILRESQEQTKLMEQTTEIERDEFDEFDDFEFEESNDDNFFDVGTSSKNTQYNGYTIAPPVVNRYESKEILKDSEPIFNQKTETNFVPEKKKGFFSRLFHKKKK